MAWFEARCPVVADEQAWIEEHLSWFVGEFGDSWLRSPVVLPTDEFFPGTYSGSQEDIRRTVARVSVYMGIDPDRVRVTFHGGHDPTRLGAEKLPIRIRWSGASGYYSIVDGRPTISLSDSLGSTPMALIATIAHELAHERLRGEGRIACDRPDYEPLTDLLTVYLGLGIFTANSAFEFSQNAYSWGTRRMGYLTEPMFGYALACYAWMRGEGDPAWARYLDANPRAFLKKGLRFLRRSGQATALPVVGFEPNPPGAAGWPERATPRRSDLCR